MALLARIIKEARAWVELSEGMPGDMEFPAGVISDLYNPRGTSFWLVNDRESEDVRRLVANWACEPSRTELAEVEIRFVDREKVEALGMTVEGKKPGAGWIRVLTRCIAMST
jgi:hypothetical protein